MKKPVQILSALVLGTALSMNAQTQRINLFEEWTGENCGPCAATNPGITTLADDNYAGPKKLILLRYQVAIPSAPSNPNSLYQQNPTEPTQRQSYYYPTASDRFAPQGRFNGGELGIGDPNQGHAGFLDQPTIDGGYIVDAPFALTTGFTWNAAYDSVTITTTITAAQDFSTANPLKLHLAITEEHIHYATAPGSNGEKNFEFIMRKMVPNQTGQSLGTTWTNGQTQTVVNTVKLPTYIWNKGEVAIVAFIQEDVPIPTGQAPNTVRTVHQAAYGNPQPLALDASVSALAGLSATSCSPDFTPTVTIQNSGVTPLTSCTINYNVDGTGAMTLPWTGNLATGQTEVVTLPMQTTTPGTHTFNAFTSSPNGASDNNAMNDNEAAKFIVFGATGLAPISQTFAASGIPAGYNVGNTDGGYTWARVTTLSGVLKYDAYNNGNSGDIDHFYLPRLDFSGMSNMELSFDVAHRIYSASYSERLQVMISTNCGATWTQVYNKAGATLASVTGAYTSAFTPTAAQFRHEVITLPAYANAPDVLIDFKVTNAYGNNVYIDNINVANNVVGIKELSGLTNISVYPNPANNNATLQINSDKSEAVNVVIYNTIGQAVSTLSEKVMTGTNTIELNTTELANGIYNIVVSTSTGKIVQKLTVNH